MNNSNNNSNKGFNYRIAEFFLNNSRITILSFLLVVVIGAISVITLKTTGFPNPEIEVLIVNTTYSGASAKTVEKEVTIPIEAIVKDIDGVESYNSNSSNSFSSIGVSLREGADSTEIKSTIESEISSLNLDEGVEKSRIFEPSISGADFLYLVKGVNKEQTYNQVQTLQEKIAELNETSFVKEQVKLERFLEITFDEEKLSQNGISQSEVEEKIKSFGQTIPVVSNETIDGENKSVVVSLKETSVDDLENLSFVNVTQENILLKDLVTISVDYLYESPVEAINGVDIGGTKKLQEASVLEIDVRDGFDTGEYEKQLQDIIEDTQGIELVDDESQNLENKNYTLPLYSVNTSNDEQVQEVIGGLVGSPLEIDNQLVAQVGWLLGGIQLVFLVMLAFVSWRAAVIGALSIPLSLVFSTIYLLITGNDLNTLVLFSLVLVIGLVVDPALVILESIQRKVDSGLRGKAATLAAVKDVGGGLFLATLTNVIVFAPFGLISGVLGQIFSYIPLTIIPAVVGSYVVPLIFLAWIGGGFLRKERGIIDGASEEENLWGIAKALKKLNLWLLRGNGFLRFLIITLCLGLSIGVSAYYFGTRQVRSVQFSGSSDSNYLVLSGEFLATSTANQKDKLSTDVLAKVLENQYVKKAFVLGGGFSYYIELVDTGERDLVAKEVVDEIEVDLKQYEDEFFDLVLGVESNGPPAAGWQVALGVSSSDSRLMRTSSVAVGQTLQKLCQRENQIKILDDCGGKDGDIKLVSKVDNGFVGKESSVIDIQLEREKLAKENLVNPALPVGINVVEGVKNLFEAKNQDESTIELNGEEFNLKFSRTNLIDSVTTQDIETTELGSLAAPASTPVQLSEVATIKEDIPQSTINRVNGEVINVVQARLVEDWSDEATAGQAIAAVVDYYAENDYQRTDMLGLEDGAIEAYSEGSSEGFAKSFQELIVALLLAIILTYFVLAVFFGSLTMPLVVLYTIPLTFIGIFPAIAYLSLGEFGFLEIIGMIILVGIVENVAIFLVDSARQYMREGMEEKEAIALASAIRMRPVILTNLTATASLAPLALFSEFYRSLSLVIIFGLLTSGLISLITTPILFIFFHWLSKSYREMHWINRVLFFPLFPFYIIYLGFKGRYKVVKVSSSRGVNLYEN